MQPQVVFARIKGNQESGEKHFGYCETGVECEACNMETRGLEQIYSSGIHLRTINGLPT